VTDASAGPSVEQPGGQPDQLVGQLVELEVGAVAHGGHCVARLHGRVVFVRHTLPGEIVRARVTEGGEGSRYLRADAVEILSASPDRVAPPCPYSGPGACGGCDWQHAGLPAQRALKAAVVREQLHRLARLDVDVTVEPLGDRADGLGWRTRVQHGVDGNGRLGFRRHRSHDVLAVDACPITHESVAAVGHLGVSWPGAGSVEVAAAAGGAERLVVVTPRDPEGRRLRLPEVDASVAVVDAGAGEPGPALQRVKGRTWVAEQVAVGDWRREFRVTGAGFWQVHPAAATTFVATVLDLLAPRAGERALDLYSGVGLFAAALAHRVGPSGAVVAVESDARAVADARRNLHDLDQVRLVRGAVAKALPEALAGLPGGVADVVVLDPPRVGAGRRVVEQLCQSGPRAICYVACDPAALARDVATAGEQGYQLAALRAFDAFPMTHHVECVALFER
jgi:tRNA/tmRNA/rRNA uracil-C5-methylase (TrmA/RlmC/RlmD family)